MDSQDVQRLFLLFKPKKEECDFLREYNNLLILQIDEMKLHSFHKEEVKAVLRQTITKMMTLQQNMESVPKAQNWLFRLFHKTG